MSVLIFDDLTRRLENELHRRFNFRLSQSLETHSELS